MASNRIVIGNYELHETIGNGSFGKVKLAVHQYTGHNVALKIINRRKIANMDMVGRIKREILFLRFLRHPHIIKLYEVITTPTDILMVMEFAGGELFKYIVEKGRLSEDESRRFFQQLISAVDYCHRHNIVHRDLKPENLLLDEFHNLKIADFGLSNIMADGEFLKTSCGSPNYAAPEVINGKYYAGPEVDVWSCGVILYVMLCGRLPFDDENIPALFRKISSGVFSLPNSLSNEAKALLLAMLVVEPGKRITIPEIQELAWYKKDLPEYLIPSPENEDDELHNVDEALLKELTKKMGFNRMTIYQALQEVENNQIKVTYQLLADHKRGNLSRAKPSESFFSGISPSWSGNQSTMLDTADPGASLAPSNIKVLSSSLPKRLETPPPMPDPTAAPNTPVGTITVLSAEKKAMVKKKTRSRWHYGLRSKSAPLDIMLEIYRALKSVGMEWKPIDAYHVRARWTYKGQTVKLDIQIYKVDRGSYLVDFK
ncbi:kinase-like domain-containing protein, partial [Polychytrium aggregatum]|uniref:kinase-like domain-containing protein n=1 Tax=Polychytrium aggregatum TaxID=110093 RepID=UPI0022FDE261